MSSLEYEKLDALNILMHIFRTTYHVTSKYVLPWLVQAVRTGQKAVDTTHPPHTTFIQCFTKQ